MLLFIVICIVCILLIPTIINIRLKSVYNKYSRIESMLNTNGISIARVTLDKYNLKEVNIKLTTGNLTDRYDNDTKTIYLTNDTAYSKSVASIGIALHEVGHAIQYSTGYILMDLRILIRALSTISLVGIHLTVMGSVIDSGLF